MCKPLSSACSRFHRTIGRFLPDLRLGLGVFSLILFLVFAPCSVAQQPGKSTSTASRTATSKQQADAAGEPLQKTYDLERAAAQTGSPAAVEDASQKLAAMALREMAALSAAELRYEDSIKEYERSLTLEDLADVRVRLAMALSFADKPADAIRELDKALQTDPQNASAWFAKGKLALQKGDPQQAIEAFTKSAELKPDPNVQFALANAYLQLKQKRKRNRYSKRCWGNMGIELSGT